MIKKDTITNELKLQANELIDYNRWECSKLIEKHMYLRMGIAVF